MSILINLLLAIFVIDAFLLILIVLMQRPKSEGLGAAFGGGMTENLFGAQTTNVLANFTRWLGGIFFSLALLLSILYARQSQRGSTIQQDLLKNAKPIPAASAAASPGSLEDQLKNVIQSAAEKSGTNATPEASAAPQASPAASAEPTVVPVASATPAESVAPAPAAAASAAADASPKAKAAHSPSPANHKKKS